MYYPYNAVGLCAAQKPDNSFSIETEGYDCGTAYLYIKGQHAKCVPRDYCVTNKAVVLEEKMICVPSYDCMNYGGYLYQGQDGNECVSAKECLEEKNGHAYSDLGECVQIDPEIGGGFVDRADDITTCVGYSVSQRTETAPLLYFGDTARCVSRAECFLGMQNI